MDLFSEMESTADPALKGQLLLDECELYGEDVQNLRQDVREDSAHTEGIEQERRSLSQDSLMEDDLDERSSTDSEMTASLLNGDIQKRKLI
ncbi:MAG: hypothetical protein ACTJLM_05230 [Ehrlichia sp.]